MNQADDPIGVVAERLHAAAIRVIRHLRDVDSESGISPPKLSVLSILAFVGRRNLMQLAAAEQVSAPTMSKLVADLETEGLVEKQPGEQDRRQLIIQITPTGRQLMEASRGRRLSLLRQGFIDFTPAELKTLADAAELMLRATQRSE